MDEFRNKDFRRKKFTTFKDRDKEEKPMKRPIILMKARDESKPEEPAPPRIILKTRDGENRAISPNTSKSNNPDPSPVYHIAPRAQPAEPIAPKILQESVKFLDETNLQIQETLLEYLHDTTDFFVIGCIGTDGVGKSTLLSHLAFPPSDEKTPLVFKKMNRSQIQKLSHCTNGIDAFITPDRIILLDTQPLFSLSVITNLYGTDGNGLIARSCSRDDPDFPNIDNDVELLSLQYITFLMTVCHVLIVVQESLEPDVIRFLHMAEMLKPNAANEDENSEHFPHTVLVHTKSSPSEFTRETLKSLQLLFKESQLRIKSGIGLANGSMIRSLTPNTCGDLINLFLLPKNRTQERTSTIPSYFEFVRNLKKQLYKLVPLNLTNTQLTEKNWYYYALKSWETIKKSPLYPEYGRLLPASSMAAGD